jgi:citronellol/citronellal dehydrogenase
MITLAGKTVLITGASRGIGRAIALRVAAEGANVVIAAKTATPHARLAGTIHSVAQEVEQAGGQALAIQVDVRSESAITSMVEACINRFGGLDALVNNAGAISLTPTLDTPAKRFDLMHQINVRATFLCSQAAVPHLKRSANPHILNLSPPLTLQAHWYVDHLAYTLSKMGMSLCTLGMAEEFKSDGIAVNSLWPKRIIATAATSMLLGVEGTKAARRPEIVADAAYAILTTPARELTGRLLLDEDVLGSLGKSDFAKYDVTPGVEPLPDLFVDSE